MRTTPTCCLLLLLLGTLGCQQQQEAPVAAPSTTGLQPVSENGGPPPEDASVRVRPFEAVRGTRVLMAEVVRVESRGRLSSYDPSADVNRLFYDLDSRATHALFETNAQRILSAEALLGDGAEGPDEQRPGAVRAYLYRTVHRDTDGDGALEADDGVSLALSSFDGTGYSILAPRVDGMLGTFPVASGRVVVLYRAGERVEGVELDLGTPALVHRATLAMPPEAPQ